MYRSSVDNEKVHLVFFLRVKDKNRMSRISQELSIRMRKLMNSPVQVFGMEQMSETDKKLLSSVNGNRYYNSMFKRKIHYKETDK
jgi:hypothetical protein